VPLLPAIVSELTLVCVFVIDQRDFESAFDTVRPTLPPNPPLYGTWVPSAPR